MSLNYNKIDKWVKQKNTKKLLSLAYNTESKNHLEYLFDKLANIQSQEAAEGLIHFLLHENQSVWMAAQKALGEIGAAAIAPIDQALWDDNYIEKQQSSSPIAAHISNYFDKFDLQLRCVESLAEIIDQQCSDSLIKVLENLYPDKILTPAVVALGKIQDKRAVPPLINLFNRENKFSDRHLREAVVRALGKIGSPDAVPALIEVLQDPDENAPVQNAIAEVLGNIGDPLAVEALCEAVRKTHILYNDTEHLVDVSAAEALGKIGDSRGLDALEDVVNEPELYWLHQKARNAIAEIKRKSGIVDTVICKGCGREKPASEYICSRCGFTDTPYGDWKSEIQGFISNIILRDDGEFIWSVLGVPAAQGHNQGHFSMELNSPQQPETLLINVQYDNGSQRVFQVTSLSQNAMDWVSIGPEQDHFYLERINKS